ncbi:hypothetical protein ACAG24_019180 [Mycobacterium sp. pW049]|uniref:hypothetical protein n=1 Tax=[Mycobacterium] bulgaricum TaxID=3238985 RepID=UPI0035A88ED0
MPCVHIGAKLYFDLDITSEWIADNLTRPGTGAVELDDHVRKLDSPNAQTHEVKSAESSTGRLATI